MNRICPLLFTFLLISSDLFAGPPHSISIGNEWMCENGYKKVGNSCEKIFVPKYGVAVGDTWMCQNGYKKVGNSCEEISIPKHAVAIGDTWQCEPAFKRSENECIEKSYDELVQTINNLVIRAVSTPCDDFERSCKANCNSEECENACEDGKSECEYEFSRAVSNACNDARSSCVSKCGWINNSKAQASCETACSSGESSCD
jgi:hypothetical protein